LFFPWLDFVVELPPRAKDIKPTTESGMWEKVPCRICGRIPTTVNGRITHFQCIDQLIKDALPRMEGNEGFKEYLDASALLERSKMDYEQFRSSFPLVSEGFWVIFK
jgi:hypothetical protein